MTSSNGNIFRVTGHLCGELTGHWWIPHTKASDTELWCFLCSAPEWTIEFTIVRLVIWDASHSIWHYCNASINIAASTLPTYMTKITGIKFKIQPIWKSQYYAYGIWTPSKVDRTSNKLTLTKQTKNVRLWANFNSHIDLQHLNKQLAIAIICVTQYTTMIASLYLELYMKILEIDPGSIWHTYNDLHSMYRIYIMKLKGQWNRKAFMMTLLVLFRRHYWIETAPTHPLPRKPLHCLVKLSHLCFFYIWMAAEMWCVLWQLNSSYWEYIIHYNDVIMSALASQITNLRLSIQQFNHAQIRKKKHHQSSASLAFVREIHRWLVNSP